MLFDTEPEMPFFITKVAVDCPDSLEDLSTIKIAPYAFPFGALNTT